MPRKRTIPVRIVVEPTCNPRECLISGVDGRRWADAMLVSGPNQDRFEERAQATLNDTIKAWLRLNRNVEVALYGSNGRLVSFHLYKIHEGTVSTPLTPPDHKERGFVRVDPKTKKRHKVSAAAVRRGVTPPEFVSLQCAKKRAGKE